MVPFAKMYAHVVNMVMKTQMFVTVATTHANAATDQKKQTVALVIKELSSTKDNVYHRVQLVTSVPMTTPARNATEIVKLVSDQKLTNASHAKKANTSTITHVSKLAQTEPSPTKKQ